MSGICGIMALDGSEPSAAQITAMTALLERRGPDGTHHWQCGNIALGHTLLATTPEALHEDLPLTEPQSGCTISADVRLDNRDDLLPALGLGSPGRVVGDGELILHAYLKWGEDCPLHLLGDFAFAIWDPRKARLFCARDHMGMRQLIYCHLPGKVFAFATEPRALLTHHDVPKQINEGRIADYLEDLEGIDFESTFHHGLLRLPPAHRLTIDPQGMNLSRYWRLEAGPELKLATDAEYEAAFLKEFGRAVACRLRSLGPVASMLSGGMDSGSIAAVASRLLAEGGEGPLHTFSAIGPDPENCVETRAIIEAAKMPNLVSNRVDHSDLNAIKDDLAALTDAIDEPFDGHMTLPRAVYFCAKRAGFKVVLDGAAGDVALNEGSLIARLFRRGRFIRARSECRGSADFYGFSDGGRRIAIAALWRAFVPWPLRALRKSLMRRKLLDGITPGSLISSEFARAANLKTRRRRFEANYTYREVSYAKERASALQHQSLLVGRERYDRVAAALAIEPRDPFIDIRFLEFCLKLPAGQLMRDGWPKIIMRKAMAGKLPDQVRWRKGKEHLGWTFTCQLSDSTQKSSLSRKQAKLLAAYVSPEALSFRDKTMDKPALMTLHWLSVWLNNFDVSSPHARQ